MPRPQALAPDDQRPEHHEPDQVAGPAEPKGIRSGRRAAAASEPFRSSRDPRRPAQPVLP
jgi:hypothetical protein